MSDAKTTVKQCHEIIDKAGFAKPSNMELPLPTRVQMICDRLDAEIGMTNSFKEENDKLQTAHRQQTKELEVLKKKNGALTANVIRMSKVRERDRL